jgi:hypothetical protein
MLTLMKIPTLRQPFRRLASPLHVGKWYISRLYVGLSGLALLFGGLSVAYASGGTSSSSAANMTDGPDNPVTSQPLSSDSTENPTAAPESDENSHSSSQSVNVESNQSSTSVTVNGDTTEVPNGETYDKSFHSESAGNTSDVHISVQNDSQSTVGQIQHNNVSVRSRSRTEGSSQSNSSTSVRTDNR